MSKMSDYLEVELRKHIFRTGSFTKPTALWVALFTTTPSDAGGGVEVAGGSYNRVNVPPLDANWTGASSTDGLTDNAADIVFPAPTADWGTVEAFAIFDANPGAPGGGNMLVWGALTTPKTIQNGDQAPKFAVGDLDVIFA